MSYAILKQEKKLPQFFTLIHQKFLELHRTVDQSTDRLIINARQTQLHIGYNLNNICRYGPKIPAEFRDQKLVVIFAFFGPAKILVNLCDDNSMVYGFKWRCFIIGNLSYLLTKLKRIHSGRACFGKCSQTIWKTSSMYFFHSVGARKTAIAGEKTKSPCLSFRICRAKIVIGWIERFSLLSWR